MTIARNKLKGFVLGYVRYAQIVHAFITNGT